MMEIKQNARIVYEKPTVIFKDCGTNFFMTSVTMDEWKDHNDRNELY